MDQFDGGDSWIEFLSSILTLVCIKLTISTNHHTTYTLNITWIPHMPGDAVSLPVLVNNVINFLKSQWLWAVKALFYCVFSLVHTTSPLSCSVLFSSVMFTSVQAGRVTFVLNAVHLMWSWHWLSIYTWQWQASFLFTCFWPESARHIVKREVKRI